jgi:ribosome biogenesis GTPase A
MAKKSKKINYDMGDNIHDDVTRNHINWFPGHMNKAIRQIKESLKKVNIVLEVRDARSPLVTGNRLIKEAIGQKSHLIVINKTNLADPEVVAMWDIWFEKQNIPFVFVNSFDKNSLKKILNYAQDIVKQKFLESNPDGVAHKNLRMMMIGLPNTGKSTIINRLANRNASRVADKPGLTQQQIWIKVDQGLEILDTPGVMPPKIANHEQGLWLASLHAIPDTVVSHEVPACFIVEHCLEIKSQTFKEKYKLESFDTDLISVLDQIATLRGCLLKKGEFDYDRVYKILLSDFRSGELGPISLGRPPLD